MGTGLVQYEVTGYGYGSSTGLVRRYVKVSTGLVRYGVRIRLVRSTGHGIWTGLVRGTRLVRRYEGTLGIGTDIVRY